MADWMLVVSTVLAFISLAVFIVTYSRVPWYATTLGKALMAGGLSVGLLTAVGLVRRIDTRVESVNLGDVLTWGSVIAYLTVAAVWAYKTYVLARSPKRTDENREP